MAEHGSPLEHVIDHPSLEIPWTGTEVHLPQIMGVQVTRFMVMEIVAALLILLVMIPLSRHIRGNRVTRGAFWNLFEAILVFIRDGVARPAIGAPENSHNDHGHGHEGDASHAHPHLSGDDFLPYLWTVFFFVLFNNLLGMIPGGASPTGNINVTAILAIATLCMVIYGGTIVSGPVGFWKSIVPTLDVPKILKPALWGLMFVIEFLGLFIKHSVLAVRLFANMLAGHIVLAVILGFTLQAVGIFTYMVTPASVAGVIALSLLELFVAFLQAYIFTFLSALFIGTAVHPH
jgi:F-type H+-transporting ATPase subunit a